MKFASSVLAVIAVAVASAQMDPNKELFFTESKAIVLLPPQVVGGGITLASRWSPDSKFLLVHSLDVKAMGEMVLEQMRLPSTAPKTTPDQMISIYDLAKQTSRIVWRAKMDVGSMEKADWLPGSGNVLLTMRMPVKGADGALSGEQQAVWKVSVGSGQITSLFQPEQDEIVDISSDPLAKGAIMSVRRFPSGKGASEVTARYFWIGPTGTLGGSIAAKGAFAFGQVGFFQKGTRPVVIARERSEGNQLKAIWLDMDFASGLLRETKPLDVSGDIEPEPAFRLLRGGTTSAHESKTKVVNLNAAWLVAKEKSDHQSAIVAAEVDTMSLSPAMNAVFYTTKGVGMVRQLLSIPKELAIKALTDAEKARVMSDAKQVATALHIYAADYDDNLPSNSSDWMEALYPYTKNRQLLDGFVYTFGGGNLGDIKDPAKTELGYKDGPGGRAVAYADGHVKWIPNP